MHAPLGRRTVPLAVMMAGGVLALVGSFLPWVRSGSRSRNSYDVFRVVGSLGFAPDGPAAVALRWWPLVPLLAVGAVVAVWWGWSRTGGGVGVAAALYAGPVGLAVWTAPAGGLVDIGAGPALTAIGGAILLAGSAATIVTGARAAPAAVTGATDPDLRARP